jgi:acyl phosphate:glycerol-3-phosphate acyltransferase
MPITFLIFGAIAYLLGSIPFGLLLMRVFRREDIRQSGSGNIGATNVLRTGGKGLGALTFLLDAAKGYVAVLLAYTAARQLDLPPETTQNLAAVAVICALLGHVFTIWLGFRGGKGVATGFGVFLAFSPEAALAALATFIVVVLLSRYVSLASILACIAFLFACVTLAHGRQTPFLLAVEIAAPLLIIAKHSKNIGRLLHGTEYRFGDPKASAV